MGTNISKPNQLLAAFDASSRRRVEPHLEPVDLKLKTVICEAGAPVKHVYFPEGGVLSLLTVMRDGVAVETANIGREGAFGTLAAMSTRTSFNQCLVQLEGPMRRCPVEVIHEEFKTNEAVRDLLVAYSETLISQIQQTAGCNSLHRIEARMARWLLMMVDRAHGRDLAYTHEFLAQIMGANRTSVTLAAQSMQRAGLISYRRGRMQVVDRKGMEKLSCECYSVIKRRFAAFLDAPSAAAIAPRSRRSATG
jgi:CRP-like cAMP-binding protein